MIFDQLTQEEKELKADLKAQNTKPFISIINGITMWPRMAIALYQGEELKDLIRKERIDLWNTHIHYRI